MIYPSPEAVEEAGIIQLCQWTRFLPSPGMSNLGDEDTRIREAAILDRILFRQKELGGWTPAISKAVGW